MATEFVALGAQGRNPSVDTTYVLTDGSGNEYKIKANSTTKRLEFLKNGAAQGAIGGEIVTDQAGSYTVVPTDNGKLFIQTSASGTFTLPAIANVWDGWTATFYNVGATSMAVTAPAGKLVGLNNAAGATVTFSTASNIIGGCTKIVYDATLTKYVSIVMGGTPVMS